MSTEMGFVSAMKDDVCERNGEHTNMDNEHFNVTSQSQLIESAVVIENNGTQSPTMQESSHMKEAAADLRDAH